MSRTSQATTNERPAFLNLDRSSSYLYHTQHCNTCEDVPLSLSCRIDQHHVFMYVELENPGAAHPECLFRLQHARFTWRASLVSACGLPVANMLTCSYEGHVAEHSAMGQHDQATQSVSTRFGTSTIFVPRFSSAGLR